MISKRIPRAFLVLALLGLFCGSALGQETKELTLTLEDSIVRALKNNLNVAAEVINPSLASASVLQARQMYTPTIQLDLSGNRFEQASTGPFQASDTYANNSTSSSAAISQRIPFGGTLQASLSYDYSRSNQRYQSFNPSYSGRLNFVLTQPLLKNFGWTVSRREIIVAENSFASSRSQFKEVLIDTVYSVEQAYWNLVYSIENLKTQVQALESGRDLLAKTKREVEVGTKAPIEVLNAEATVARREADILQSEASVKRSQDLLRALLNLGADPSAAGQILVPSDKPEFRPYAITLEEAYAQAMARRPDLETAKTTIETKTVNFSIAKNQRLPQLDLQLVKASPGISGQQFIYDPDNPLLSPHAGDPGSAARPSATRSSSSTTTGRPASL